MYVEEKKVAGHSKRPAVAPAAPYALGDWRSSPLCHVRTSQGPPCKCGGEFAKPAVGDNGLLPRLWRVDTSLTRKSKQATIIHVDAEALHGGKAVCPETEMRNFGNPTVKLAIIQNSLSFARG